MSLEPDNAQIAYNQYNKKIEVQHNARIRYCLSFETTSLQL